MCALCRAVAVCVSQYANTQGCREWLYQFFAEVGFSEPCHVELAEWPRCLGTVSLLIKILRKGSTHLPALHKELRLYQVLEVSGKQHIINSNVENANLAGLFAEAGFVFLPHFERRLE